MDGTRPQLARNLPGPRAFCRGKPMAARFCVAGAGAARRRNTGAMAEAGLSDADAHAR